jgi:hypothetical protein
VLRRQHNTTQHNTTQHNTTQHNNALTHRDTASPAEFEDLVQRMLAANSGFDFEQFAALLATIMQRRLAALQQQQQQQERGAGAETSEQHRALHTLLDLQRATSVLEQVRDAAVAAAARNDAAAARCIKQPVAGCDGSAGVPAWVHDAECMVQRTRHALT